MNSIIKPILFLLLTFAIGSQLTAQNTYFFDRNWNNLTTSKEKKKAKYFRKVEKVAQGYLQSDFYIDKRRTPASVKYYEDEALSIPIGAHKSYFRNGRIKSEGRYTRGYKSGQWIYYWPTGKIREKGSFEGDNKTGTWIRNRKNGELWTSQAYNRNIPNGEHLEYWENGQLRASINYKMGKIDGVLNSYYENGQMARNEIYENGKVVEKNCYTASGQDTAYFPYFVSPRFPGCEDIAKHEVAIRKCSINKMFEFIQNNLVYPDIARIYGKQGTVLLSFTVNEEGELKDPLFLEDISEEIAAACLRLFYKFPDWVAGSKEGVKTAIHYEIPILFQLN